MVKICGLQTAEHALAAAVAGAHLIGLVFAPSRRRITLDQATAITAAVRNHPAGLGVGVVGLFVNEQPSQINRVVERCNLDYVQLSGTETPDQSEGICRPILKTVRLNGTSVEQAWIDLAQVGAVTLSPTTPSTTPVPPARIRLAPCPIIVDAHINGAYGGTGHLADWDRARIFATEQSILLAGGLTAANVASAIVVVQPWGVDVSSGVESNGSKSSHLIEQFVSAVRAVAPSNRVRQQ